MWVKDKEKNSLTILDNRVGGGDMTPLQFVSIGGHFFCT
jgi:hypothetical protein